MKKAGLPVSMHRLAIAAARCVFPVPCGPVMVNHPDGFSEKSEESFNVCLKICLLESLLSRPYSSNDSKVYWLRYPKLLYASNRRVISSSRIELRHSQAFMDPKSGCPVGTMGVNQPLPPQMLQSSTASWSSI